MSWSTYHSLSYLVFLKTPGLCFYTMLETLPERSAHHEPNWEEQVGHCTGHGRLLRTLPKPAQRLICSSVHSSNCVIVSLLYWGTSTGPGHYHQSFLTGKRPQVHGYHNVSQLGLILPPRGHLATSREISDCYDWGLGCQTGCYQGAL